MDALSYGASSVIGPFLSSQDPLGTANADNAFTLYYVKFRAAAPKVRVRPCPECVYLAVCFLDKTNGHNLVSGANVLHSWHIVFTCCPVFQTLIEQVEQRSEKIPE